MIPYTEKSERGLPWHTTFIGQLMQHNYWLYSVVDKVMIENPDIESIVEIGTGRGALTTVFGLWGIKKNIPVLSIDNQANIHNKTILEKLGVELLCADEFAKSTKDHILKTINNKKTWVYCDGGNKTKEFTSFSYLLPKGSIISAHDLGVEFNAEEALKSLPEGIVEPYKKELWLDLNIQLALFKVL